MLVFIESDYTIAAVVVVKMFKKNAVHPKTRFRHAFTACSCVFKVITLVGSNHSNYFDNATACSKRTLKMRVATQLYEAH